MPLKFDWALLPLVFGALSACVLVVLWRKDIVRPGSFPTRTSQQRDVHRVSPVLWLACAGLMYVAMPLGVAVAQRLFAATFRCDWNLDGVLNNHDLGAFVNDWMAGNADFNGDGATNMLDLQQFIQCFSNRPVGGASASPQPLALTALTMVFAYVLSIGVGVAAIVLLKDTSPRTGLSVQLSDARPGLLACVALAPLCALAMTLASVLSELLSGKPPEPIAHDTLRLILQQRDNPWTWVLIGTSCLGAPIAEELLYRAFLQSGLLNVLQRVWMAIIGTSAVFTAMHVIGQGPVPWHAAPILFVLSVGMGVAYERTGRLGVPIIMHVVFNCTNVLLAMLLQ